MDVPGEYLGVREVHPFEATHHLLDTNAYPWSEVKTANTSELSPIWRKLPHELKLDILDRFTDDFLFTSCGYWGDLPKGTKYVSPPPDEVYKHWLQLSAGDSVWVCKSQRQRLERHFRDRWPQI